jgi:hypothetical protein
MARTLVVPGVSVETRFDVAPPLPARSGILGAIGVTDRDPGGLRSVTSAAEAIALYGAATRFSFPELFSALENGVSEAFVSPVAAGSGRPAELRLRDDDGEAAVILRARAPGPWGNRLSARVVRSIANDGRTVRRVSVELLHDGTPIERHDGLVLRPGDDSDLFAAINRDSGAVVAIDPVLETDPPAVDAAVVGFTDSPAAAATGAITQPGNPRPPLVNIAAARAGEAGNRIAIAVRAGRAVAVFNDAALRPALRVLAERAGAAGADIAIGIAAEAGGAIGITVQGAGGAVRTYTGLASIAAAVSALDADPDVIAERAGDVLPAATAQPRVNLAPTVTVTVTEEGLRSAEFADLPNAQAMVTALDADPAITATLAGNATQLPDVNAANSFFLAGGRDAGPARSYEGRNNPGVPVLELTPAPESDAASTRFRVLRGSNDSLVRIIAGVAAPDGFLQQEVFEDLSMDPDHPNFLPAALATSRLLRATDRFVRSGASVWPVASFAPQAFTGGAMPGLPAWRDAVGALANEDAVDMLIAGLQAFGDPALDGVAVQQAMLGAARSASDNAAPRFVVGSIRPAANRDVAAILDHVQLVADRRFMLCAPAGVDGAIAGLLGHLDYFQSPTFKTLASPGAPLVPYSEGELNKLVGPDGNICVVLGKRGRGTICVKGIAADGFQISVVRVADRCTREVKKIADRFIGELNNAEQRNALRQMIVERFTAMEREGALVPSTDGKDPAFLVDVFASQTDAAGGIVRVDIAVRPVRAIDFVYATIRVKN